jgi:hypothetical protein
MQKITTLFSLGILVLALGGCSVFGIATQDDLDEALRNEAAQRRMMEDRLAALQNRLETVRDEIDSFSERFGPQITAMDAEIDTMAADLDDVYAGMEAASQQWDTLRSGMIADLDSLRAEFDGMQQEIVAVRSGVDSVTVHAEQAALRSREAIRVHYENLLAERERLTLRLQELDGHLQTLQPGEGAADGEGTLQSASPESNAAALPAGGRSDTAVETGRIEIRAVTPERTETGSTDQSRR